MIKIISLSVYIPFKKNLKLKSQLQFHDSLLVHASLKPSSDPNYLHFYISWCRILSIVLLHFSEISVSRRFGVLLRFHLTRQHGIAHHAAQRKLIHVGKLSGCVCLLGQLLRLLVHVHGFPGKYCFRWASLELR